MKHLSPSSFLPRQLLLSLANVSSSASATDPKTTDLPDPIPPAMASNVRVLLRFATFSFAARSSHPAPLNPRDFSTQGADVAAMKLPDKPPVCTADELHYVSVANSGWRLALWRYLPPPKAPKRNHPLLLLSGIGTNAIGYDLSPDFSFARYMSRQGFDTWILEVRGAGLSTRGSTTQEVQKSANAISKEMESAAKDATNEALLANLETDPSSSASGNPKTVPANVEPEAASMKPMIGAESKLVSTLTETFTRLSERLSGFSEDFQKQLEMIMKYDWDFDHYLEEDVPAAMEYVRAVTKPEDGKLLAIGHSMGGILLYSTLSRCGYEEKEPGLAAIVTVASSLDYTPSKSILKLLIPLADPAQVLNVPAVPLGALLSAAYPLSARPPYVLSWLNHLISAEDMMHPETLEKLVLNNFCTIPAKLLLQLTTAFKEGGLRDRSGKFFYKEHLHKIHVPILALAGDKDLICPCEAVEETVKLIPEHLITYKVFGDPSGPHYAHYDLVGGRMAVKQVYPCIVEFLIQHDCCDERWPNVATPFDS